jgi:hypothetical protein
MSANKIIMEESAVGVGRESESQQGKAVWWRNRPPPPEAKSPIDSIKGC